MAEARTIKLILSDGTLAGSIIAELSKWDGILLSSPRLTYNSLENVDESKFYGVYLLTSKNNVYIGQSSDLIRTVKEHDKNLSWWNNVVLLSTRDNSFTRSDIDYIETKLIDKAIEVGVLDINNYKKRNDPKVSKFRKIEMRDYIEGALLILELIGVRIFLEKKDTNNITKSSDLKNDDISIKEEQAYEPIETEMNKSKAMKIFEKEGINFKDSKTSYSTLQEIKRVHWSNPQVNFLNKNWYLILNNPFHRTLTLLNIPGNTLKVKNDESSGLFVRKDNPNLIDLNLHENSLIDQRSKISFINFTIKTIKY